MSGDAPALAPAHPMRSPELGANFDQLITADQYAEFTNERWPSMTLAFPIAIFMATKDRQALLEKARILGESKVNDEGEDGLSVALRAVTSVQEFCVATGEIMDALAMRLLLVADDLLIESGQPSAIAAHFAEQSAAGEA